MEDEQIPPANHCESFGDGTRMLEILFNHAEPERMTIALSVRDNSLFELVAASVREEFSALESGRQHHVTRFEI